MPLALKSKAIVIIGGTSGIGLSAARAFVAEGARLIVVGYGRDACITARHELGKEAIVFVADARLPQTATRAVAEAVERYGDCHGLYHVAGGSGRRFGDGPLHEMSDRGLRSTLALNLESAAFSNRAAVKHFLSRPGGGAILNVGSVLAYSPSPRHFATHAYAAAKAGLIGLTRSVASHYASSSIRANLLAPGLIETPMSTRACADPKIRRFVSTKQPLDGGRVGEPADCDQAAVYLLSEASRFVTGQVLGVDGGWAVSEGQSP